MKKEMLLVYMLVFILMVYGCGTLSQSELSYKIETETTEMDTQDVFIPEKVEAEKELEKKDTAKKFKKNVSKIRKRNETKVVKKNEECKTIEWSDDWKYAENSKIHSDSITLYRSREDSKKNIIVAVNAGHGTNGGSNIYTLCHPDGSPKMTGGSTDKGNIKAVAVATGTTMLDGTSEAMVTLKLAVILKEVLLDAGYDVLMIREKDDVQIDNVARTVYANNNADCHISLHYDSTHDDKGLFCIGVPNISEYKSMEPVASHWKEHNVLGKAIIEGEKEHNVKLYGNGFMGMDLTQISYSTIPSVDIEAGDRASDYSKETMYNVAKGIVSGVDEFFEKLEND